MRRIFLFSVCVLLLLSLFNCKKDNGGVEPNPEPPKTIEEALALWEAWNIQTYTLDQKVSCLWCDFDGVSARIYVRSGKIQTILQYPDMTPVDTSSWWWFKTVKQLFEFAMGDTNVYRIEYDFDPRYGFPTWVQQSGKNAAVDDYILGYKALFFYPGIVKQENTN